MKSLHTLIAVALLLTFSTVNSQEKKSPYTYESQQSILQYLDDNAVNYDKKDVSTLRIFDAWGYLLQNGKNEFPSVYFFNSKGESVKLNGDNCSQTLKKLHKINDVKVNKKEEPVSDWLKYYISFIEEDKETATAYDGYIVISWAKFAGNSINETSFNWYKSAKEYKDLNLRVILLNFDVMDTWEISDENKKVLGLE
ncbi:hypothetical protein [Flavobacterium beibuense]|uniref:Uncharacterized protein n=1 Tax=Flavobacterium beibuense TaxID=657326 RepID=A0A444WFB7_9FLAO|nr:hypothetical protein [Flavobacterium beibuense]RYJ44551.1 hypothetical protein NU09_1161 [Flavobacterium beibuense]